MSGIIVAGNNTNESGASQLIRPRGIFVDDAETLYVADCKNHRIQRWSNGASSGVTVAGTEVIGNSLTQLESPTAVIVDSNGYIYIAD
ncbi:unnamed protein product [Rotaria sp. Silwood2]|nr:unnamed protein product [Rotaria sp. Silwood2]